MTQGDGLTERQSKILKHVQDTGFATIEAMAEAFGVSMQTVRRDLIELERQDILIRFHGGAGLAQNLIRVGYADKRATAQDGKQRIAATIAALIPERATVYIDIGSTVECVARALPANAKLRIVTASAAVGAILAQAGHTGVFLPGGNLSGANGAMVGEHAKKTLSGFRFDYMVTSFGGFDPEGQPMDFDPEKIALRQIAMAGSLCRIGAIDASKFHRHALTRMFDGLAFTHLVTDAPPPPHVTNAMAAAGTDIIVAGAIPG